MKNELYIKEVFHICRKPIKISIFVNGLETSHASKEVLAKIVQKAQKMIQLQKELIDSFRDCLRLKFEAEEEQASELLTNIVHNVVNEVLNKNRSPAGYKAMKLSQHNNKYIEYVNFDNKNAKLEAFGEYCLYNIHGLKYMNEHTKSTEYNDNNEQDYK
ncbi:23011_t:CDS:2 [Dentiscutata erythropus]|uniref:23011_t:CDS:1 n=1 Tax=Dentiscutata erythropus TaxID=1348616 RepID=A0A9N9HS11_9GLOM|nr:23011_t:CDS:2 [Dentiscutata erythropus]